MSHSGLLSVIDDVTRKLVPNPCSVVRENPHPGQGTVLVLGTPRGGTSAVAGICHVLGVPMGVDLDRSNVEDRLFHEMLASSEITHSMQSYFADVTAEKQLVGVKNPVMIDRLPEFYGCIPNPLLVVVSRDVFATAQREECSGEMFITGLRAAIRRKYAILEFVESVKDPLIVVSYERLLSDPGAAAEALCQFIHGQINPRLIELVSTLVRPNADMPDDVDFVEARERYERQMSSGVLSVA